MKTLKYLVETIAGAKRSMDHGRALGFAFIMGMIALPAHSQFLFPDNQFKMWVQAAIPNAFHGDTLMIDHPDVAALDTLIAGDMCVNCTPGPVVNLSGLEYFTGLTYLDITRCRVAHLTNLHDGLRTLKMDYMPFLQTVDHWPDSARYISLRHDYYSNGPTMLAEVPPLPSKLEYIDLYARLLGEVPPLPPTIRHVKLGRNNLNHIPQPPEIPAETKTLWVMENPFNNVPYLPDSLEELWIGNSGMSGVNNWGVGFPPTMKKLIYDNVGTYGEGWLLPDFPDGMEYAYTYGTKIKCYPVPPPTLTQWTVDPSQGCIPLLPPSVTGGNVFNMPICNITTSICPVFGGVMGTVFLDENGNGVMDEGEPPFPAVQAAHAQPGDAMGSVQPDGRYFVPLEPGTYTISAPDHPWYTRTTPDFQVTIDAPLQLDSLHDIGYQITPGIVDLKSVVDGPIGRPGFEHVVMLWVRNEGTQPMGGQVTLEYDPVLEWIGSSSAPVTHTGHTAVWDVPQLTPGQWIMVSITFSVPADFPLGDLIHYMSVVEADEPDVVPGNDVSYWDQPTMGSFDPNAKSVTPSSLSATEVANGARVQYRIDFQNTGTYMAERVVITDTLPDGLVRGSLVVDHASHAMQWFMDQGVLHFVFDGINLPDSTADEPNSHGYVLFDIAVRNDLLPGTVILNEANIYFDFNAPVITDPCVLEVVPPPVRLDVRAFLGGSYDPQTGLMRDDLRAGGLLPWLEPYSAMGYVHAGGGGGETVAPLRFSATGSEAIVDWVVLELRDAGDPASVLHSKSVLLRRDGKVVATDGRSAVSMQAVEGDYYVALRHRNHLGMMTAAPVSLGLVPTMVDFTDADLATWGTDARMELGAISALWPGDADFDGRVKYTGLGNDRDKVLQAIGGEVPTNVVTGYHNADVNLDGAVRYTGMDNDRDLILQVVGGTVPTTVRNEQIPE